MPYQVNNSGFRESLNPCELWNSETLTVTWTQAGPITSRVIEDEAEWDAIRDDWNALFAASPGASPPLDFTWLRGWWRVYGPTYGTRGLRVVTVWRGNRLIGAAPLYLAKGAGFAPWLRHLRFVSTGEAEFEETCPEYLNLLYLPDEGAACAARIWDEVRRIAWDHLEFLDLADDSPCLLPGAIPPNAELSERGTCPVADLTGGFDSYLARLSPNSRQQARRLLREGERVGAKFEVVSAEHVAVAFDELVRLHQQRWVSEGKPGVFAAPRFAKFHHQLLREWLPDGRAILARLSIAGEPVAMLYGFLSGQKFDFYQSGVRLQTDDALRSPGNLAHLLLMRELSGRGVAAYDFLRGSSSYKERLATRHNGLFQIHVWKPTLRSAIYRSVQLGGRIFLKAAHFARRRTP